MPARGVMACMGSLVLQLLVRQGASGGTLVSLVRAPVTYVRQLLSPPPTSQDLLVKYAKRASPDVTFGYREAEVINDMKLVGMSEMRAVTVFKAKKIVLKEKMAAELAAKRLPADVIKAITESISSVSEYTNSFEDFAVDSSGTGYIFKATVMLKPDREDDEGSEVAMAVSGAKFDAATQVEAYDEEEVPVFKEEEEIVTVIESGLLGQYKVPKTVKKMKPAGTTKKRTPIFKQKVFTKAKLETIKRFLESKTLGEVKMLYAPDPKDEH